MGNWLLVVIFSVNPTVGFESPDPTLLAQDKYYYMNREPEVGTTCLHLDIKTRYPNSVVFPETLSKERCLKLSMIVDDFYSDPKVTTRCLEQEKYSAIRVNTSMESK